MTRDIWLIWELTKRELSQRYRGTFLGVLWPVLYAAIFLGILSFVFTFVMQVRWTSRGEPASLGNASLMIFCGMVPYLFLAEVLNRSPLMLLSAQNLVKRVRFPVAVIPIVNVNAALVLCLINTVLLLGYGLITGKTSPWAIAILPLLLVPLYLFALGISWLFSSVTIFFRDLAQVTPVRRAGHDVCRTGILPQKRDPGQICAYIRAQSAHLFHRCVSGSSRCAV